MLVFEFISGGGLIQQQFSVSLAREGLLMLQTLIDELGRLVFIEVIVLLDWRIEAFHVPQNCQVIQVLKNQSIDEILPKLIQQVHYVWPIAPEIDSELEKISRWVELENKQLLNSSSLAVNVCSDKWKTFQVLLKHTIPTVKTFELDSFPLPSSGDWVIKPKDGTGCFNSFFISSVAEFGRITNVLGNKSKYIVQPFIKGDVLSLSCLFREGKAWLLCCNRQRIKIEQGQFVLTACEVNSVSENRKLYENMINQIAEAIIGLWGYVGIDLIMPLSGKPLVLEINPRLTSSYAGIFDAIGINVAATVVSMITEEPIIKQIKNFSTIVNI